MDIIHTYTREQAIEDGVLIDVSKTAKEAGFVYPVAVTQGVWAECIAVPEHTSDQDESGRLWDVLSMLRYGIAKQKGQERSDRVTFQLYVKQHDERPADLVTLWSLCGPGDNAEPVITVMLPHED